MSLAGPTNTSLAVVRDQELSVHEQLDIVRQFGALHKHATTLVTQEPVLEEVQGAFSKIEFWHSDMTYAIQSPSSTSLKVMAGLEYGGDMLVMLFIPPSVHEFRHASRVSQLCAAWSRKRADLAQLASASIASPSKPYTLSSVSPGWKSVYVNAGVTRRMLGVPNVNPTPFSMSCSTRSPSMLTSKCASTGNRIQLRSNIRLSLPPFDLWPQTRQALRATPHGEKLESVEEYERRTGKVAKERQMNRDSSIEEGFVPGTRIQ